MSKQPVALHRTIVVVDIAGFGNRTDPVRAELRDSMHVILNTAMLSTGIDVDRVDLVDGGDGALVLVPADVPKNRLVERLPEALVAALREYNVGRPDRLRFRLVLHAGEVIRDRHGYVGEAINTATGLLDSGTFRAFHQLTDDDLVVAVTDPIYRGVVEQASAGTDPGRYRQVVIESIKNPMFAWLRSFGGGGSPPMRPPPDAPWEEPDDLHHRSILIADIEDSDSRADDVKRAHRAALRTMLSRATEDAGIAPDQHEKWDTGDGMRMLFAPDVPKNRLIDPLVFSLVRQLRVYNREVPRPARMRLRAVLDAGELRRDREDYFGSPLNEACWLAESAALRNGLRGTSEPLALMVSDEIYDGVVRHGYGLIRKDEYARHIVPLKSRDVTAWLWTPPEG